MSRATDRWYVRFPDGRVLRAASTAIVRQQLGAGRIPTGSSVRRHRKDDWVALDGAVEFADLAGQVPAHQPERRRSRLQRNHQSATVASRLDSERLHTLGIGPFIQELIGALDSALVRRKLIVAGLAAVGLGILFGVTILLPPQTDDPWLRSACCAGFGLVALVIAAFAVALLTQLTFVEVSRLRPARWQEGMSGIRRLTVRTALAHVIVVGLGVALIGAVRQLPGWTATASEPGIASHWDLFASWAVVLALVVEAGIWPLFGFALLLAPILAVEGCSVVSAMRQWARLVQGDTGRVFLYEAIAVGLGAIIALPLSLPLIATAALYADPSVQMAATFTRIVLGSVVLAPVVTYLIVANVFIYLNLRYDAFQSAS